MLLAFDVGNTNIVLGVFKDGKMVTNWRMETDNRKSADEYGMIIHQLFAYENLDIKEVKDVIISTVVPSILYTLQHLSQKYFNTRAIVIGPGIKTGLIVKYDNPKQVGADRIVNAVAAHNRYGGHIIVIDFGTATTLTCVTGNGDFLGGAIAPGLKTQAAALFEHTAKLPNVDLEIPGKYICKNTSEAMQSGLIYGHMGFIEHMVRGIKQEMAEQLECKEDEIKVVATGGMATMVESGVDCIDVLDRRLTLDGLQMLYEKNRGLIKKRVLQD